MNKLKRILGMGWASPVTLLALIYVGLFTAFKWYRFVGVREDALVWQVNVDKVPTWLGKAWAYWGAQTLGNVIVSKFDVDDGDRGSKILVHEQAHVEQYMKLGILFLPLYGLFWLTIKVSCRHSDAYFDNPLEVDSRRAANQIVDVLGAVKRAKERGAIK